MQRVRLIFVILLSIDFLFNITARAQQDSTSSDTSSTITVGTRYSTNTNVFGSLDNYITQPSFAGSLVYKSKKNIGLYFSPIFVGNSDSTNSNFTSEYDIGASYSFTLWEILSFAPTYTHYFYSQNSTSMKSGFNNFTELTTSLTINWWDISIAAGYGWGQANDFLLNAGTSACIQFENFLGKDNVLTLQPIVALALNNAKLKAYLDHKKLRGLEDFLKLHPIITAVDFLNSTDPSIVVYRESHPVLVTSITNRLKKMQSKSAGKKPKTNFPLSDLLAPSPKFGLASINISLPVTYKINSFSIIADLQYNRPNNQIDPSAFYFGLGISYSFGL
jgi:hypothetical protein